MAKSLGLESLELRALMAVDVTLSAGGELLMVGDDAPNVVRVESTGQQIVVHRADQESLVFSLPQVNRLRFLGRPGDDHFTNLTSLPSIAYGNQGNDTLIGGSRADRFHGGPGDDELVGNDGNDELHGDHGNDRLDGGRGNDSLHGWYGDDALMGGSGNDYLSAYEGNDWLHGGSGDDVLKGHEGDDLLIGDAGNDELYGWEGNDRLFGGDGDDYLSGRSGHDLLVGGKGDDYLRGHAGRDLLIGGKDTDRLDGGSGQDILIGGWTQYDDDLETLDRILAAWQADEPLEVRKLKLLAGAVDLPPISKWAIKTDGKRDALKIDLLDLDWSLMDHKDYTTYA
jgi:hypothetical protein